jgi:hypothetical protein
MAQYKQEVLGRTIYLVNFCWSWPAVILVLSPEELMTLFYSHDSGIRATQVKVSQFALESSPLRFTTRDFIFATEPLRL